MEFENAFSMPRTVMDLCKITKTGRICLLAFLNVSSAPPQCLQQCYRSMNSASVANQLRLRSLAVWRDVNHCQFNWLKIKKGHRKVMVKF